MTTADATSLTYRNSFTKAYPGSIHALEGMARVTTVGGTTEPGDDGTLTIKNADQVLVMIDIRLLYDPAKSQMDEMKAALANLPADYAKLLDGHAKIHGALFKRMRLDLGGGGRPPADHRGAVGKIEL